jgi:hypothetical protein
VPNRVLIIANKWFEADPLVYVFGSPSARPNDIRNVRTSSPSRPETQSAAEVTIRPRATFELYGAGGEVWCIQDLMNPAVIGKYSNTLEKARVLPFIFSYGGELSPPALVIAVGTAATPVNLGSYNGSVTFGTNVFLHNPYAGDPDLSPSKWHDPEHMDRVLGSSIPDKFFDDLSSFTSPITDVHDRLLQPPGLPAGDRALIADRHGVAVSSVNVVDAAQYAKTDTEALVSAQAHGAEAIVSLETTHGVIRVQSEAPFVFISGITNRVGHFTDENLAFPYRQNFVAAHNAAISLAWVLPKLIQSCSMLV